MSGFYDRLFFERARRIVRCGLSLISGLTLVVVSSAVTQARDIETGGDGNYPYSIMAPEPGTGHHRGAASARSRHLKSLGAEQPLAAAPPRPSSYAVRGSSGSVLPTPLPKTQLIPPEGGSPMHTCAM